MPEKSEEVNYKKNFCEKYFDKGRWDLDVLNQVDVLLKDKNGSPLLYIESKYIITNEAQRRQALAQVILTNKKQDSVLSRVALIYQDAGRNDVLELIDCSEDSVMYNNDINWKAEKPSSPTKDAVDRINDRLRGKITAYVNGEINDFYRKLKAGGDTLIEITEKNFNVVYNQWKNEVRFREKIGDEQDLINLFLVDILNGTKYERSVCVEIGGERQVTEQPLIREGTNLSHYKMMFDGGEIDGIKYSGGSSSEYFTIADSERYDCFWRKYRRPPEKDEFLKILERSATLYSEKYRRDTGGEYTPTCFVEKQNEILERLYGADWKSGFVVCDPCAGVGNLENQFGKDFKQFCYLSTLEQMDVDICKIKGFENSIQFDYLKSPELQPKWKHKGENLDITEICRRENRRLMVVMNPPYQRKAGFKNDLAVEFFNKVLRLKPDVVVYYCKTEFFLRSSVKNFVDSGYKIVSHIFSNAKTTFRLSEWPVSQVIFEKPGNGSSSKYDIKNGDFVTADRYELNPKTEKLEFARTYTYDNKNPDLIKEIEKKIRENNSGMVLGQWCYLNSVLKISNGGKEKASKITTENLKWCLLSKGINFNTHHKYFEWNYLVFRGTVDKIPEELFCDAVMFSLFYKGILFTNKSQKNYIMPFTAEELGCARNDLNVLFPRHEADLFLQADEKPFDFRDFLRQFDFSKEAMDLYSSALEVFRYYHRSEEYQGKDWNDSFYDITNAIMGKDAVSFRTLDSKDDRRIAKVKTTKGTRGFGRSTVKFAVASADLPLFEKFFDARDILARKINSGLLKAHLLLWERENIY